MQTCIKPAGIQTAIFVTAFTFLSTASADNFTQADLDRWHDEYDSVVREGERLFHGGLGNANTVSCDQCHPNATNTHPETTPNFNNNSGKWRHNGR